MKHYKALLEKKCFSWSDVCSLTGNVNTASNIVQSYLKKDFIRRVKKNLYVAVDLAKGISAASKFLIASNINPTSYVSHQSAFEYHGYYNQIFNVLFVSSSTKFNSFEFEGLTYCFVKSRIDEGVVRAPDGVRVTDLERTILDSINDFEKIGGLEELLRNLSSIPLANEMMLLRYLNGYNKQFLYQKTGYLLEHFMESLRLGKGFFEECNSHVGQSVRYLYRGVTAEVPLYNARWRLYVPSDLLFALREGVPHEFV